MDGFHSDISFLEYSFRVLILNVVFHRQENDAQTASINLLMNAVYTGVLSLEHYYLFQNVSPSSFPSLGAMFACLLIKLSDFVRRGCLRCCKIKI